MAKRRDFGEPVVWEDSEAALERFVADFERKGGEVEMPVCKEPSGFKVGVIGSGPAGLACAAALAIEGESAPSLEPAVNIDTGKRDSRTASMS